MMAHCGLAQSDRSGQIAAADLAGVGAEQQRHQFYPHRIGESFEPQGNFEGRIVIEGTGGHRRATHR